LNLVDNSSRGIWSITKDGEKIDAGKDQLLSQLATKKYSEERSRKRTSAILEEVQIDNEDEAETNDANWKDQLLELLRGLRPDAFERLAQRVLREAGFIKVEVTGRSGDGGIDGIGVLRVNLLSFQVLFRCKRYQGSVGAGDVRNFRGAMIGRSDKGLVITTGTFTPDARREATRDGAPAIDLIDGDQLCDLLKELRLGIRIEMVEKTNVEPAWFQDL